MSLFRRQLLITSSLMLAFILLGYVAAAIITRVQTRLLPGGGPSLFARLVDEIAAREHISPAAAVEWLNAAADHDMRFQVRSIDQLEPHARALAREAKAYARLDLPGDVMKLKTDDNLVLISVHQRHDGPPPPPGPPILGGPPGGPPTLGGPPGGSPILGGPPPPPESFFGAFGINFLALVVAILIASSLSVFSLFYAMRAKGRLAERVLSAMKAGDLKARFPVTRTDEVGRVMVQFNAMADEVERLVARAQGAELARMRLLQELAHDLRTPIASLRGVLETLHLRDSQMTSSERLRLLALSVKETAYFEHLVEDLLFLAQVTDPKYHVNAAPVDLRALLRDEALTVQARAGEKKIALPELPELEVAGDERMLRRLFRNAFENAAAFARTRVEVQVKTGADLIEIEIRDDGLGLSPETIEHFGQKRASRVFLRDPSGHAADGRVSVGLGAVIMVAVVQAHGGTLAIDNLGEATRPRGAVLRLRLKIS